MTVNMQPSYKKCVLLTTELATVEAEGTQTAYINATNYAGTHQDPARHWKWDTGYYESHYYRLIHVPYAIEQAKQYNVPEAAPWLVSGSTAAIEVPIKHKFTIATEGRTHNTWFDADSPGAHGLVMYIPYTQVLHHRLHKMGPSAQ